ncbi:MAG: 16S rRNA (guanine(966)-N(2))-methyltransferase RsmD [Hyphomonadaceae bacterium]
MSRLYQLLLPTVMRIVAGKFKGRPLTTPKGRATRPTSDRARETLFNVLAHADWAPPLEDARIIDLFAGSGSLGLEALSRGAAFSLFVDTDNSARGAIRSNIETLALFGVSRIHRRSATALGPRPANLGDAFDLVFIDPPYNKDLVLPALQELKIGGWLNASAVAVVETGADEELDFQGWEILNQRISGAAKLTFMKQV